MECRNAQRPKCRNMQFNYNGNIINLKVFLTSETLTWAGNWSRWWTNQWMRCSWGSNIRGAEDTFWGTTDSRHSAQTSSFEIILPTDASYGVSCKLNNLIENLYELFWRENFLWRISTKLVFEWTSCSMHKQIGSGMWFWLKQSVYN